MKTTITNKKNVFIVSTFMLLFIFSLKTEASHFRFGHLTWKPKPSLSPNAAEFTLISAFRRNGYSGTAPDGFPAVGNVITESIGGTGLNFGDGVLTGTLRFKVIAIDVANNWILGSALQPGSTTKTTIDHIYPSPTKSGAPWIAEINSCCRTGIEINNPNGNYKVSTQVELQTGNSSPVSSLPAIVNMVKDPLASFLVPASDPNPNTILKYRLASSAEAGGFFQPTAGGFALSIDPNTGIISWNTSAASLGQLYSCQVIIEDYDATTLKLKTQVAVDFLIQISGNCPNNIAPSFSSTSPPCGSSFSLNVGDTLAFTVKANDSDLGGVVSLNSGGLPSGATITPSLPIFGNPVESDFKWIPTTFNIGSHVITFTATDNCGVQTLCSYTVKVEDCSPATINADGPTTFCFGDSVVLSASAGDSYLWSTGEPTQAITVRSSSKYSVEVTKDGCKKSAEIEVNVLPLPTIIAHQDTSICYGQTAKLNATGGTSYIWSPINATGASITVSPAVTTFYIVEGTDTNGCSNIDTVIVKVNTLPSIDAGTDVTVYYGYSPLACTTLNSSISGGTAPFTQIWNTSEITSSINVCPTSTTTYSVEVKDLNGCTNSDEVKVFVIDARCGKDLNKVAVCHSPKGNPSNFHTICIGTSAVPAHLSEHSNDYLGACSNGSRQEETENNNSILYAAPNPFSAGISISLNLVESEDATLEMFDMNGNNVQSLYSGFVEAGKKLKLEIDGSLLPSGIYSLRLKTSRRIEYLKIVKY